MSCPFPAHQDDTPSFCVHSTEGNYICHGCGEKGGSLQALGKALRGEGYKVSTSAPAQKREKVESRKGELPNDRLLSRYVQRLWEGSSEGLDYLREHGISDDVIRQAKVGFTDVGELVYPVYRKGRLVQCKFRRVGNKKKQRMLAGRGVHFVYPEPLYQASERLIICAGEPDALAAISAGANALTNINGEGNLEAGLFKEYVKAGPGSTVWICMDNDPTGEDARVTLARGFLKNRVQNVYMVRVPEHFNDLSEFLHSVSEPERPRAMTQLLNEATPFEEQKLYLNNLVEMNNQILSMKNADQGSVVAPFAGRVLRHGMFRQGNSDSGERYFEVQLTNQKQQTIQVQHRQGQRFVDSLSNSPGFSPSWGILERDSDRVFNYISRVSADEDCERKDSGWVYGWIDDQHESMERFVGPEIVISDGVVADNTTMVMQPEVEMFRRVRLPKPDEKQLKKGMDLLLREVYSSQYATTMAPLLAQAVIAPIRRKVMPTMPRFITFVRGLTGCGKTTRSLLVQNLFGDFPTEQTVLDFTSTPLALQNIMAQAGDMSLLVDDFKQENMGERDYVGHRQWMQAVQGMGRQRMQQDGRTMNQTMHAHCMLVVTIEAMPSGDASLAGRSLILEARPGQAYHQANFIRAMQQRELLPQVLSSWVREVSSDIAMAHYYQEGRANLQDRVQAAMGADEQRSTPNYYRLLDRLTDLSFGWLMFLRWCKETEDGGLIESLEEDWWERVIPQLAETNLSFAVAVGPSGEFLDNLLGALAAGRAYMRYSQTGQTEPRWASPSAICAGFIDTGKRVYLSAAVASLDPRKRRWQDLKQYLLDNKIIDGQRSRLRVGSRPVCYQLEEPYNTDLLEMLRGLDQSTANPSGD